MKAKSGKRANGEKVALIPHAIIAVSSIPQCNFDCDKPGEYDFATRMGPWANGCEEHWKMYRASSELGAGIGQLWIDEKTVEEVITAS